MSNILPRIYALKGRRDGLLSDLAECQGRLRDLADEASVLKEAQPIVQGVAQSIQKSIEDYISGISTLALQAVYGDDLSMKLIFESKRNQTEAKIVLVNLNGLEIEAVDGEAGGVVDVASLGLRLALWCLSNPRSRPVFILDEPFRNVSKEFQPKASAMLKAMADRLGIQFIIVTHNDALIECADRVFEVKRIKGVSKVCQRD